jgi:aspartyl/asparaginyl beta-hydroxylase
VFTTLKLPFQFDCERLRKDLAKVLPEDWVLHYNRTDYDGDWRGAALRSSDGATRSLIVQSGENPEFEDTPLLARCPYFREVLATFECPLKTVRLLSLAPQSFIREHTDRELQYEDGEVRIHIPIQTNPRVEFYSQGERLLLEEACSYYLNASLPHRVSNRGTAERVHLVIDARVNEWVHALFRQSLMEDWSVPRIAPEDDFTTFQNLVLEDRKLDEQLRATQSENFLEMVCELGEERGLHFAKADVQASVSAVQRGELPPATQLLSADKAADALRNWVPVRVHLAVPEPVVEWQYLDDRRFTDSFFSSTVATAARVPYASVFRRYSTLEGAEQSADEGLMPSGFIFHMSRCGSTLVSQMLAALPANLVLSEAAPIDHVVQAEFKVPSLTFDDQVRWLRQIVRALGRPRSSAETRYFLKLDSWHIHKLPLFRAAFPETPWVFLYRDPLEVLAGQMEAPSLFCVPGMTEPRVLGLTAEDGDVRDRFGWCCKVLSGICQSALRYKDASGIFVNYSSLPEFAWGRLARHFGLQLNDGDIVKMRERTQFHSKNSIFWTGKDQTPRVLKDESQRLRAAELFDPIYRGLESAAPQVGCRP